MGEGVRHTANAPLSNAMTNTMESVLEQNVAEKQFKLTNGWNQLLNLLVLLIFIIFTLN